MFVLIVVGEAVDLGLAVGNGVDMAVEIGNTAEGRVVSVAFTAISIPACAVAESSGVGVLIALANTRVEVGLLEDVNDGVDNALAVRVACNAS